MASLALCAVGPIGQPGCSLWPGSGDPVWRAGTHHPLGQGPQGRRSTVFGGAGAGAAGAAAAAALGGAAVALRVRPRCAHGPSRRSRSAGTSHAGGGARVGVARRAQTELVGGFISACSTAKEWEQAIDEVAEAAGSGYEAGFAFVSEMHVTLAQGLVPVLEKLRERLGVQTLVGCACGGAIGQAAGPSAVEYSGAGDGADWPPIEVEQGAVLSVGLMRDAGATPFFLGRDGDGDAQLLSRMSQEKSVRSILLIADPFAPAEDILKTLDESFPSAVKAGGIAAALQVGAQERGAFMPSIAIAAEGCAVRLCNQGVVGLLLSRVDVHSIVCQGCCGVGPPVKVSSVQGPVCNGIGGRPAQEALRLIFSAVDPATRAKMQQFLTVGLGSLGESESAIGDGDWLIRGIGGVTPDGGLVIGGGVSEGQPLRFHVRDRESAEADLALMLKRYRLERTFRGSEAEPAGCFLFTCNGRGEGLYGRRHVDARAAATVLGDAASTRIAGFFCNGEVGAPGLAVPGAPADGGQPAVRGASVHGFTAVFALLIPVLEDQGSK